MIIWSLSRLDTLIYKTCAFIFITINFYSSMKERWNTISIITRTLHKNEKKKKSGGISCLGSR